MTTTLEGGLLDVSRERVARLQCLDRCISGGGGGVEGPYALSPQELSPPVMVTIHRGVSSNSKKGIKNWGVGEKFIRGSQDSTMCGVNSKHGGRAHQTP